MAPGEQDPHEQQVRLLPDLCLPLTDLVLLLVVVMRLGLHSVRPLVRGVMVLGSLKSVHFAAPAARAPPRSKAVRALAPAHR